MPEDGATDVPEGRLTPSQEVEEDMLAAEESDKRLVVDSGSESPVRNGVRDEERSATPMTNGVHGGLEDAMKTEVEKIQEYLQRSDTAVIFPEPVDVEESKKSKEPKSDEMLIDYVLKCPHCNKVFTGQSSIHELRDHLSTAHREREGATEQREKRFVCAKCNAAFGEREHLEKHELLHTGSNQRHMLSHDESAVLRKFKCPECGKAFKFKHHLKEHIRIHSGEKPFACPNCGKRFSHSGSYSSHMTSKKCLVVNLKVRKMDTKSSRGRGSNQNNAFRPIIPKYGSAAAESVALNPAGFMSASERFPTFVSDAPPLSVQPFLPAAAYASVNFHSLLASHFQGHYSPFSGFPDVSHLLHGPPPPHLPMLREKFVENNNDGPKVTTSPTFESSFPVGPSSNCHPEAEEEKSELPELLTFPPPPLKDLNTVKKILQIVDATVGKQQVESPRPRNGGVLSGILSPMNYNNNNNNKGSSDSGAESGDERHVSVVSDRCRHCDQRFHSRIELHQHERYLCKMNSEVRHVMESRSPGEYRNQSENGDEEVNVSDDQDAFTTNGDVEVNSESQLYLREHFTKNPKPKKCEILKMTRELGYPLKVVQMWFQRMRNLEKDVVVARKSPSPITDDANATSVIHVPHYKPFVSNSPSYGCSVYSQPRVSSSGNPIPLSPPSAHLGTSSTIAPTTPTTTTTSITTTTTTSVPLQCLTSVGSYRSVAEAIYSSSIPETDQPLDLSIKNKNSPAVAQPSPNTTANCDGEVLNLSQKSSRNNSLIDGGVSDPSVREDDRLAMLTFHHKAENECFSTELSQRLQKNDFMIGHHLVGLYNRTLSPKLSDTESHSTSDSAVHDLVREGNGLDFPLKYESEEVRPTSCSDVASPEGTLSPDVNSGDTKASSPFLGDYDDHVDGEAKRIYKRIWKQGDMDDGQSPLEDNGDLDEAKRRKSWKHHKMDAEEGMYSCDQCDKVFSKQSSLARHKYEHSGQRPHKCDVCHKAFKHKHHLTEHKRLHSGEKPFQCKKCLKRFSHSGSYSQHMNHRYSYCKPYRE